MTLVFNKKQMRLLPCCPITHIPQNPVGFVGVLHSFKPVCIGSFGKKSTLGLRQSLKTLITCFESVLE